MPTLWILWSAALGLATLFLGLCLIFLLRQIGLLEVKVAAARPRSAAGDGSPRGTAIPLGPRVGEPVPAAIEGADLDGVERRLAGRLERPHLLLFVGTRCAHCARLLAQLAEHGGHAAWGCELLVVGNAGPEVLRAFRRENRAEGLALFSDPDLVRKWGIRIVPHAVFVDRDGVVRAAGMTYELADLERVRRDGERAVAGAGPGVAPAAQAGPGAAAPEARSDERREAVVEVVPRRNADVKRVEKEALLE